MTENRAQWTPVAPLAAFAPGSAKVFKSGPKQVAVFHLEDGALYAIDNRCPHEGYPLAQGYVKSCVLTCAWHNFKFDLRDGSCVMGDEAVRTFPVRVQEGRVEIDLADPDPETLIGPMMKSLYEGMSEYGLGRISRDIARLLQLGVDPKALAAEAAIYDGRRAEWGSSHALPVAADTLRYLDRYPGLEATLPLIQAFDIAARGAIRLPERAFPPPADPGDDPIEAGERLRNLVENEQAEQAQSLLRGALKRGWARAEIEPWLFRLCADHFLSFGHGLIYVYKVMDLLEAAGWEKADPILTSLLFRIINGTREDTLPKWAGWQKRRMALRPTLGALYKGAGQNPMDDGDRLTLFNELVDGTQAQAFAGCVASLEKGHPLEEIAQVLVASASERLLRFDLEIDADPTIQNNWLDTTHILTFSDAVSNAIERWHDPGIIELILQAAHFVNHARPLDMPGARRYHLDPVDDKPEDLNASLMAAIEAKQTQRAIGLAALWHQRGGDDGALRIALEDRAILDPATRPIFVAHHIKTTIAAFDRYEAMDRSSFQALPLLAAVRFVASGATERPVKRMVHEAITFVAHGKTPRLLT